jgi:hypothetical protein
MSYKDQNDVNLQQFEQQRILQSVPESDYRRPFDFFLIFLSHSLSEGRATLRAPMNAEGTVQSRISAGR